MQGALEVPITKEMNISSSEFEQLYSLYAWPNVVLPIVGGFLMDNVLGLPLAACIYATFVVLGNGISAIGAFSDSYLIMKISRLIFGILKEVAKLPCKFWLVAAICSLSYVAVLSFTTVSQVIFEDNFGFKAEDAESLQGVPYLVSAIFMPLLGLMMDRVGRNIYSLTLACFISLLSHIILIAGSTKVFAYIGVTLMGIGFSLLPVALWPMISMITSANQRGIAFGFAQACQNLTLGLSSVLVGYIIEHYGYFWVEMFFVMSLIATLIACLVLWIMDYKTDKYLQMTPTERMNFELTQKYTHIMENSVED